METKLDFSTETLSNITPIFDIDDLSFFRFYGLGLRHTELELGLKESKSEKNSGDAVSFACYGQEPKKIYELSFESSLAVSFQEKVEQFILDSFGSYHSVTKHYTDAAFSLIIRGDNARTPYDFGPYPLGKCGKKEFSAQQMMALMTTENDKNDDINHAVYNVLMHLKKECRRLKIEKAKELINSANPNLKKAIEELIEHYQNDTFLNKPFFLVIHVLNDLITRLEKAKSILNQSSQILQEQIIELLEDYKMDTVSNFSLLQNILVNLQNPSEILNEKSPKLYEFINQQITDLQENTIVWRTPFSLFRDLINTILDDGSLFLISDFPELIYVFNKEVVEQKIFEAWLQELDKEQRKGCDSIKFSISPIISPQWTLKH